MVQNPAEIMDSGSEASAPDVDAAIKENMGLGKKHYLCSDYSPAIVYFQDACSLLSEKHGEMSEECSEAYYYYGVSLLELARMENGVLGNALKGVPESEESDKDEEQFEKPNLEGPERLKLRVAVASAMSKEDSTEAESSEASEVESDAKEAKSDEKGTAPSMPEKSEKSDNDQPCSSKAVKSPELGSSKRDSDQPCSSQDEEGAGEELEDPDDVSNMQLAWEMLELAKVLFMKKNKSKENYLMIAQCHLKLGELGLELENYEQAIDDLNKCLVLQQNHLAAIDRKLAETHYNLGLAYTFQKMYEKAWDHYKSSRFVLQQRISALEFSITSGDADPEQEASQLSECKEVSEIKELMPDINSKIEDVLLLMRQNSAQGTSSRTTIGFGSDDDFSSPSPSVITVKKKSAVPKESTCDITHLVRRKRGSPDDTGDGGDVKKLKQESSSDETAEDAAPVESTASDDKETPASEVCAEKMETSEDGGKPSVESSEKPVEKSVDLPDIEKTIDCNGTAKSNGDSGDKDVKSAETGQKQTDQATDVTTKVTPKKTAQISSDTHAKVAGDESTDASPKKTAKASIKECKVSLKKCAEVLKNGSEVSEAAPEIVPEESTVEESVKTAEKVGVAETV